MSPSIGRIGSVVFLIGLLGCKTGEKPYEKTPLVIQRKPMLGSLEAPVVGSRTPTPPVAPLKPVENSADKTPSSEPVPPAPIESPIAAMPTRIDSQPTTLGVTTPTLKFQPIPQITETVSRPADSPKITPAHRSLEPDSAVRACRYAVNSTYSRLRGAIDKHYEGRLDLRYCDPAQEDRWGGKVCLEADARLCRFQDGDIVEVEGELIPPSTEAEIDRNVYPRYRIRTIRLLEARRMP